MAISRSFNLSWDALIGACDINNKKYSGGLAGKGTGKGSVGFAKVHDEQTGIFSKSVRGKTVCLRLVADAEDKPRVWDGSGKMQEQIRNGLHQLESSDFGSATDSKPEYGGEVVGEAPYFLGIGTWSPQFSEEEEQLESLSTLEAASIICILEDAVDELSILKYVIGAVETTANLRYKTLRERYTRRLTPIRIFPEADNVPVMTSAVKLQRDREAIESVFYKTTKALAADGTYDPLSEALETLQQEDEDDKMLVEELKQNLLYLKDLRVRVGEKRRLDEREVKERDELMYQLQDEMDDVILKCEVEEKFVKKWENVRKAQNDWKLRLEENNLKDKISKYSTKMKLEKRVSHELQLYLKLSQAELEDQLEQWMATYDTELERRENKILHLKYNRDQAEEKKHQLHDLYAKRTQEIKEWIAFRELRKLRSGASLRIQSWWRGMMVRKKLGPYKPKKEKAGKKK